MTALLLDPTSFLLLLVAGALASPPIGLVVARRLPGWRRTGLVLAAFGPFALVFWGIHNLVLRLVGFDSIFSVAIVIGFCAAVGWIAGGWAAGETAPKQPTEGRDS